jgi:hypothetical protein
MSTTFRDQLPPFFQQLAQFMSFLALDILNIFDLGCTLPEQDHFTGLLMSTLAPLAALALIVAIRAGLEWQFARNDAELRDELMTGSFTVCLILVFLVYPGVSSQVLKTFAVDYFDDGRAALAVDHSIDATTAKYTSFAVYAGFMTLVWPMGVPAFYFTYLYRERARLNPKSNSSEQIVIAVREQDPSVVYLRFLWCVRRAAPSRSPSPSRRRPYKPPYYWFEVFELIRKLAQTSLVVFVRNGSAEQMIFQLVITGCVASRSCAL